MIVIIHYHEIALKGKNRPFFEKMLCGNILKKLKEQEIKATAKRISGRILLQLSDNCDYSRKTTKDILEKTFGIKHFAFSVEVAAEIKSIKKQAILFFRKPYPKSFKVKAQRSEKNYVFTSKDLENEIGAFIQSKTKIPVDLENPQQTFFIEIVENKAFLYTKKNLGPGGLPYGVSGKVVSLISSGIDSPVASWYFMKRGCEVIFLHFHSSPYVSESSQNNARDLVRVLRQYSPEKLKLLLCPFGDIQRYIIPRIPSKFRVIFYRKIMMRIASKICEKEKALGIVTGESLGQVASQTLENIRATSSDALFPIYRPLIGFDKENIVCLAKEIGTYKISSLASEDCCTLFMPSFPATKCRLKDIKRAENGLGNLSKLIEAAVTNIKTAEV
jgi:thiamine biosynthesis protein ThiI